MCNATFVHFQKCEFESVKIKRQGHFLKSAGIIPLRFCRRSEIDNFKSVILESLLSNKCVWISRHSLGRLNFPSSYNGPLCFLMQQESRALDLSSTVSGNGSFLMENFARKADEQSYKNLNKSSIHISHLCILFGHQSSLELCLLGVLKLATLTLLLQFLLKQCLL